MHLHDKDSFQRVFTCFFSIYLIEKSFIGVKSYLMATYTFLNPQLSFIKNVFSSISCHSVYTRNVIPVIERIQSGQHLFIANKNLHSTIVSIIIVF